MGKNDIYMKRYLSDKERFADFFNVAVCHGNTVFTSEEMRELDCMSELVIRGDSGGESGEKGGRDSKGELGIQRQRDIIMETKHGEKLVLLAVENQEEIHYAMPVREMLYDALSYTEQVQKRAKENRTQKKLKGNGEFLSGIRKEDRIAPVISVVFYYGSQEWDGSKDIHGLLELEDPVWDGLKEFIPNYRINLIEARDLAQNNSFKSDLQWVFGMLKYKDNKEELIQYVHKHEEFFRGIEDDTFGAARALLGCDVIPRVEGERKGGVNMCKALDDWYQDGVNEGMEAGMERGMQLVRILFENHRMEELERALKDKEYCKKLCREYQITKLA